MNPPESSLVVPPGSDIRENVCFVGYEPQRAVGYLIQLSRWCLDSAIWREQVQIFLPDGNALLHRGWGRDDTRQEPAGALLKIINEEPERRWRILYRGPARHATSQELSHGPLRERTPQLLDLDVTFESEYEIWHMGNQTGAGGTAHRNTDASPLPVRPIAQHRISASKTAAPQTVERQPDQSQTVESRTAERQWRHSHAEQPGRIRGRIVTGGRTIDLESFGYRNQSLGTRKLTVLFDHCWINGMFASGRAFAVSYARMKSAGQPATAALAQAMIWDAGRLHVATCKNPPLLGETDHALSDPPAAFTLDLESELEPMRIDAQATASIPHSTTMDGEWLDGVVTDTSLAYLVAHERPMILSWKGERGCGHVEQSRRISGA